MCFLRIEKKIGCGNGGTAEKLKKSGWNILRYAPLPRGVDKNRYFCTGFDEFWSVFAKRECCGLSPAGGEL